MNDQGALRPSQFAGNGEENPSVWRADTLTDGVLIVLGMMFVQRSVGFLRAILFCRWMDAEQLGLWDMAFGFLMLAGPLVVLSLPGAFGRYAEYFRQRGRLRPFLLQTTIVCGLLALVGAGSAVWFRRGLSSMIFGGTDHESLVLLLAGSLLVIAAYNYSISLFTALRTVRLASAMEFVNGISFAVLGIVFLGLWRCDAAAVIVAYGGASLICVLGAGYWYGKVWKSESSVLMTTSASMAVPALTPGTDYCGVSADQRPRFARCLVGARRGEIWCKLMPFAGWIMLSNLLANLYGYVDRYLILHYAAGGECERLAMVGQYHSARVVPLLLASLATMISVILLPHLSHDWEAGRRGRVRFRLNLFLKLATLGTFAVGVVVLAIGPLMFEVAFRGKFAGGSAALPGMLAATVWFGAAMIAQQYLWCAERTGLVSIALAIGLAANAAVNFLLLPRIGLSGAVLAAILANLLTLLFVLYFARRLGFRLHRGGWILLLSPAALCLGVWVAVGMLAAVLFVALRSELIFDCEEKAKIGEKLEGYVERSAIFVPRIGMLVRKERGIE